ncbi:MAG: hypothetical protein LBU81_03595 [Methanosarcinales archaeon]|jgi:hypothetical protein|nr:hypothetical protein [Methanosarcinales archaeon]
MLNNQKTLLLIESFILSGPTLLCILAWILLSIDLLPNGFRSSISLLILCAVFVLITVLPNILFFSVLKNKLNMKIETFLYGIGFLSNMVLPIILLSGYSKSLSTDSPVGSIFSIFLNVLLLASLYYTYAAILKNKENKCGNIILFLTALALVFFIASSINNFEIIKQYFETLELNYEFFQSLAGWSIPLGLYAGHYAVYRTLWISLRNAAWASLLTICILILGFLFVIVYHLVFIEFHIPLLIFFLLISFAVSFFAGIVFKHFKKIMKNGNDSYAQ